MINPAKEITDDMEEKTPTMQSKKIKIFVLCAVTAIVFIAISPGYTDKLTALGRMSWANGQGMVNAYLQEITKVDEPTHKEDEKFLPKSQEEGLVNCSLPWIVQRYRGRLGNQMCEAATLLLIRKKYKVQVALDSEVWERFSPVFPSSTIRGLPKDCLAYMNSSKPMNSSKVAAYLNKHKSKLDINITSTDVPCNFIKFWKHRKYFIKEFKFNASITHVAKTRQLKLIDEWKKQMHHNQSDIDIVKTEIPVIVGVHVRRTDYANFLNVTVGGKLITSDYFHVAFKWARKRFGTVAFIVVTDDSEWCLKEIVSVHPDAVMLHEPGKPEEDLALLALSDHAIFDFGTFGLWGAFLAGGKVIYPQSSPKTPVYFLEKNLKSIKHPDILGLRYD